MSSVSVTVKGAMSTILISVLRHVKMVNTSETALYVKLVHRLAEPALRTPIVPYAKSDTFCEIIHASAPAKKDATSARLRTLSSVSNVSLDTPCLTQMYATLI